MTTEKRNKIKQILQDWPVGTVAALPWLERRGISQRLAYQYEESSWLSRIGRGAYVRKGDQFDWTGAVYALQWQLGYRIHVGAKTALEVQGLAHYVPLGHDRPLYLFSLPNERAPKWFTEYPWNGRIVWKQSLLFGREANLALTTYAPGRYEIDIATPERAIFEVCYLVPHSQNLDEVYHLMEGLLTLRPKVMQQLLEKCHSVKVKRLVLALGELFHHQWAGKIDLSRVKLGSGKRNFVQNGHLDSKYQITLPKSWYSEVQEY